MASYDREDGREQMRGVDIGYARESNEPSGQPTVLLQLEQLSSQQARTDELIKVLEEKLSVILNPEYDEKSPGMSDGATPESRVSALNEQIESYAQRQARQARRLERIITRINL
jgi:hypothetical protein